MEQIISEIQTGGEPYFSWRSTNYRFRDDETRRRFWNGTNRPSGRIILWDLVNALKELGVDISNKLEARSCYNPDMLREPLKRYEFGGRMASYDQEAFKKAYDRVRRMFMIKGEKLSAIPLEQCEFEEDKSSGAPWFLRKDEVHQDALNEAYAIRRGKAPPPMVVFHRGKNEQESRPVFGYSFPLTLLETRFFAPYQAALLNSPSSPYTGGKYDAQIAGLINEGRGKCRWQVELDFSGLDGSASAFLISKAFEIIKHNFRMDEYDLHDWDIVVRYFIFGPILAPDGRMYFGKDHGVSSGSMFTQVIDTIICMLAIFYCHYSKVKNEHGLYEPILRVKLALGCGDDSWLACDGPPPILEDVLTKCAELGLNINVKKSKVKSSKERPYYLGHYWHKFAPVRDVEESLIRLCCPERNRPEYWMKEEHPEVYRKALVERICRYQEDNADAWSLLVQLIQLIEFPSLGKRPYLQSSSRNLFFVPVKERVERDRWRTLPRHADDPRDPPGAYRVLVPWY